MTQTRKKALIDLRDKVRTGRELDGFTVSYAFPDWKPLEKWSLMHLLEWACDPTDIRAMGAAKALHEAALPGWTWGRTEGNIFVKNPSRNRWNVFWGGPNDNPARAWLLAIFEALIAQEPDT
jgi:hypothetical protein